MLDLGVYLRVALGRIHRLLIRTSVRFADICIIALVACLFLAGSAAAAPFRTGFFDDVFLDQDSSLRTDWFDRATSEGATVVRLGPTWSAIAPAKRPKGWKPSDPASPGYDWTGLDAGVRDASARGLEILVTLQGAPRWAQGAGKPKKLQTSGWRPNPSQFAAFATAAAKRYSGSYPDPLSPGSSLPRVSHWQIWNEPNLSTYVAPQWVRSHGHWKAEAPELYRALVNAGYKAITAVHRDNFIVGAGTAPYGDLVPGGNRIQPVAFLRDVFTKPTYLDAISHHPYGVGAPLQHALNKDDAAVPDVSKLARVLKTAERRHKVLPRGRKEVWVTEISWDSSPPDPFGVPETQHAHWTEQGLYVLWRQHVNTITWFQIRDQAPVPSYAVTNQSGVFFRDGKAKLAAVAYRFPFVTTGSKGHGRVGIWGRAPVAGPLVVELKTGSAWRTLSTRSVGAGAVFTGSVTAAKHAQIRARISSDASLTWRVP